MAIVNVTFDPINKGAGVLYTNGNLTAQIPNYNNNARATHGKSSGKWYWELVIDAGNQLMIGVSNTIADLNNTHFTLGNAKYYYIFTGVKYNGGTSYGTSLPVGGILSVLLDMDIGTIEFWKNGVSMGVAFTDLKNLGEVFPALSSGSASSGGTCTINFGSKPFVYPVPSGYKPYAEYPLNKILISSSSGEVKSASNLQYSTTTAIPKMTSNVLPSGKAFSSSIFSTNYDAWYAFDQIENNEGWVSVTGKLTGHVGYMFQTEKTIGKYAIRSGGVFDELPKSWTFEGSNNSTDGTDGTWAVLDFQTSQSWDTRNIDKEFLIENPQPFKYYRVNITEHNGNIYYTGLNELKMYEVLSEAFVKHFTKSEQNFINHGMDKSTELDLSEEISQRVFIEQSPATLGSGKVFKKSIDTSRVPIKQVSIE